MAHQALEHVELSKELFQAIVNSNATRVREIVQGMEYDVRTPLDVNFSNSVDRLPLYMWLAYTQIICDF